jgi:hypothetical protein
MEQKRLLPRPSIRWKDPLIFSRPRQRKQNTCVFLTVSICLEPPGATSVVRTQKLTGFLRDRRKIATGDPRQQSGRMAVRNPHVLSLFRYPFQSRVYFSSSVRTYAKVDRKNPTQHKLRSHQMDDSLKNLQSWLLRFSPVQFPKEICTVTFNRSTGPGGQNVNKLSSFKAG